MIVMISLILILLAIGLWLLFRIWKKKKDHENRSPLNRMVMLLLFGLTALGCLGNSQMAQARTFILRERERMQQAQWLLLRLL